MSRPRVEVHHFVANLLTRQYGPDPSRDLLGVKYRHRFSPDTEFPATIRQMDVFARFFTRGTKPAEYFIRVDWLGGPGRTAVRTGHHGPFLVPFRPAEIVRDHSFRRHDVHLPGAGLYSVRLVRPRRGWQGDKWIRMTRTFFEVVR